MKDGTMYRGLEIDWLDDKDEGGFYVDLKLRAVLIIMSQPFFGKIPPVTYTWKF